MNGLHTFWLNFTQLDSLNSVIMAGGDNNKSVVCSGSGHCTARGR